MDNLKSNKRDKEKAIYTLKKIKNKSIKYQVSLVSTMIGRAKNHPHQTKGMIDRGCEAFGKLDILIQNAAIGMRPTPLIETSEEEFDTLFKINVKSVIF